MKKTTSIAAAVVAIAGAAPLCADPPPGYAPSRFPGVNVRHAPKAAPLGTRGVMISKGLAVPYVKTPGGTVILHRGIRLQNVRRAADPRDGVIADIDPDSLPYAMSTRTASGKPRVNYADGSAPVQKMANGKAARKYKRRAAARHKR